MFFEPIEWWPNLCIAASAAVIGLPSAIAATIWTVDRVCRGVKARRRSRRRAGRPPTIEAADGRDAEAGGAPVRKPSG